MAFNDGITKLLNEFVVGASKSGEIAMREFKAEVDEAATQYYKEILNTVPVAIDSGGSLRDSLIIEPDKRGSMYHGHKIRFDGYDERGVAYQTIANTLNGGRGAVWGAHGAITGTGFIDIAQSKLRDLSKRIEDRIVQKVSEVT